MKTNVIAKNFIYHTLYQILVLIAPLITAPYVSRVLGATGIGVYNFSQSFAAYFVLVGAVGTTLYGKREIAYVQDEPEKRTRVFWEIEIFRMCATLICTGVYFFTFGRQGRYPEVSVILTLEVFATAFDISWFFIGLENFRITVTRNSVIKILGIVLVFLLVKKPEDVALYAVCLTLPIFIGNVSLWFNLRKQLVRINLSFDGLMKGIRTHIKPILILFLPQIATEVYTVLDKTMIGVFGSSVDQVGYYTQSQRIIKLVLAIVGSLGAVMMPAMSAAFAKGDHKGIEKSIGKAFQFVFMLSFALMFGIDAIAPKFVPVFFGKGYEPVVSLMILISPILVIIGMSNIIGLQFLLPTKQQTAYTSSIVTGAVVNFVLNIILIRPFDAIGASIATVIAELSVTAVQCWHVRKQLPLRQYVKPFFCYLALGLVMFAAVRFVEQFLGDGVLSISVMVGVGVLVYALELVLTKDPMLRMGLEMVGRKTA